VNKLLLIDNIIIVFFKFENNLINLRVKIMFQNTNETLKLSVINYSK